MTKPHLFTNLTQSTPQQKNPDEINKIIDEINKELAERSSSASSTFGSIDNLSSSIPTTNANTTKTGNVNSSSLAYISEAWS